MKQRVSTKILLYGLMLVVLAFIAGYSIVKIYTAKATNFTQADLTGIWHAYSLTGGSSTGWAHSIITVAADGSATFNSYIDSSGGSASPAVLTIDKTTGIITDSRNPDHHLIMASNKKLIAGTLHASGTSHPGIIIFQKEVPGTLYTNSDLQNKHFVYHELKACRTHSDHRACEYGWEYGAGKIAGNSEVIRTSKIKPSGTYLSEENLGLISVNSDGIVSTSKDTVFEGFLSFDKKTIVGTTSDRLSGRYVMLIIQITDNQSSSTGSMAGTWYNHLLAVGYANLWAQQSIGIDSKGVMTLGNVSGSNGEITGPTGSETLSVASSGMAIIASSSDFHGQVSYDGTFMVGTQTLYTTPAVYSLMIMTRKSPH